MYIKTLFYVHVRLLMYTKVLFYASVRGFFIRIRGLRLKGYAAPFLPMGEVAEAPQPKNGRASASLRGFPPFNR